MPSKKQRRAKAAAVKAKAAAAEAAAAKAAAAKAAAAKASAAKAAAATKSEDGLIEGLVSFMLENWGKLIILLGSSEGKHEDISELESTL